MACPNPEKILQVIETLLGPNGCPWDKKQTPQSLCDYLLEETYELVEAVRSDKAKDIEEEMGDVFFLLFFLAHLVHKNKGINLDELWEKNASKMIGRHPHVFGNTQLNTIKELRDKWEEIKREEREAQGKIDQSNPLDSIPIHLPPLLKAYRLNSKAAQAGFTWQSDSQQEKALHREWEEWQDSLKSGSFKQKELEFGDIIFSLVEYGRRKGIKANSALQEANQKFVRRFNKMINLAQKKGLDWENLDQKGKDELWEEVKSAENNQCPLE